MEIQLFLRCCKSIFPELTPYIQMNNFETKQSLNFVGLILYLIRSMNILMQRHE